MECASMFASVDLTKIFNGLSMILRSVRCWIRGCQPLIVHYFGPCISTSKEHLVMGLHFQSNVR